MSETSNFTVLEALWWREWLRIRRWAANGSGPFWSLLALFFLSFVLAPSMVIDFGGFGLWQEFNAVPSWAFLMFAFGLQFFGFLLAATRSGQIISAEYHGRTLDEFLLPFSDSHGVSWSVFVTGLAQAAVFAGFTSPILLFLGVVSGTPASLVLANCVLLASFLFLGAGVGTSFFFITRKLVPFTATRTMMILAIAYVLVFWMILDLRAGEGGTTAGDSLARLLFSGSVVAICICVSFGWLTLARAARFPRWLALLLLVGGHLAAARHLLSIDPLLLVAFRLKMYPFFLLPFPYLFGTALPSWWSGITQLLFGTELALAPTMGAAMAVQFLCGMAFLEMGRRGYARIWRSPETAYLTAALETSDSPAPLSESTPQAAAASDTYWSGFRNAVWTREIRGRIRNRDTATFITFSSGVTAIAGFVPAFSGLEVLADPLRAAEVAAGVFGYLVITEVALVAFIVPGITSEAIGLEREHRTLDLMLATSLSPGEILWGKLMGAASYMMLLVGPALPLFALCCLFHGATVAQVMWAYLLMLVAAVGWGALGVTLSATCSRLVTAKYATYVLVILTAMLPGSPFWTAFYVAHPNGSLMGVGQNIAFSVAFVWFIFALLILAAQWARACFQIGRRYAHDPD